MKSSANSTKSGCIRRNVRISIVFDPGKRITPRRKVRNRPRFKPPEL